MPKIKVDTMFARTNFQVAFRMLLDEIQRTANKRSGGFIISIGLEQRTGVFSYLETYPDPQLCLEILRQKWHDNFSVVKLDKDTMEFKGEKNIENLKIELKTDAADEQSGRHSGRTVYRVHFDIRMKTSACTLQ